MQERDNQKHIFKVHSDMAEKHFQEARSKKDEELKPNSDEVEKLQEQYYALECRAYNQGPSAQTSFPSDVPVFLMKTPG